MRAERPRFQDVDAAAHAAVEEHGHLRADGARDVRQRLERRRGAVELAAAVVGDAAPVAADRSGALRIVWTLDPLQQQLPWPEIADAPDRLPVERRVHLAAHRG